MALTKHANSFGEFYLYDVLNETGTLMPVYQHFAGVEYLYEKEGNWLISDEVGLREAGLQNQGDPAVGGDETVGTCPYRFKTSWEYADVEQPGKYTEKFPKIIIDIVTVNAA